MVAVVLTAGLVAAATLVVIVAHPAAEGVETDDTAGRVGFVLLLAAALGLVWWIDARSRRAALPTAEVFIPIRHIVGLFAIFALLWLAYSHLALDAFGRGRFGYLEWLTQVVNLTFARGIANVWTPYPQGTQVLVVVLQMLANWWASLAESDIWTSYTLFRLGFEVVFLVGPSVGLIAFVAAAARPFGRSTQTVAGLAMALSFGLIYYGAASAYVTDPLPVALMVAALVAVLRGRFTLAGIAIGVGTALKLFPILLLPALVVLLPRLAFAHVAASAALVMVGVFGPFALANGAIFMSPIHWQSNRPPWETWFAFVDWVGGAPHDFPQAYFQDASVGSAYGWVFTGITPLVSVLQTPVLAGPARWENVFSSAATVLVLGLCLTARRASPRAIVRWSLFCLCGFLLFGIGWSPQYELYLIPLILLAFENPLLGVATALALQVVTFLDYPLLLPWAIFYGGSAVWLEWGAVLGRSILLGWLCVWVLRREADIAAIGNRLLAALRIVRRPVVWVLRREADIAAIGNRRLAALRIVRRPVVVAGMVGLAALASVVAGLVGLAALASRDVPGGDRHEVPFLVAATTALAQPVNEPCAPPVRRPSAAVGGPSADLDWSTPGGWFFTQAGDASETGFAIVDDATAQMWSEFNRLGGWQVLGFPASQRFMWHGVLSQATQRAVLEWSPVTGQVEFANVLDLMHDEGRDDDLRTMKQIPPPPDVDEAGLPYETIAANRLAWLDVRPAIKAKYCNAPGGGDPIQLWGLPTSQAINMSAEGGAVYVLRTQRAAFQEWVEGAPWAAPGEVTVVLAGDLAKEFNLLPPQALEPESASRGA